MSDEHKDVLIAAYLFEDLAKQDFDTVLRLAEDKTITVEGVVLVQKDADGEVHVTETGDHLGRKGAKIGGGVGLAVGLLAPPLLVVGAVGAGVGAVTGRFVKHRLESGIGEKMDAALPPGSGGVIAVYDVDGAEAVDAALGNAVKNLSLRSTVRPDRRYERQRAQGRPRRSPGTWALLTARRRRARKPPLGSGRPCGARPGEPGRGTSP
jgi:arylsulfatase